MLSATAIYLILSLPHPTKQVITNALTYADTLAIFCKKYRFPIVFFRFMLYNKTHKIPATMNLSGGNNP